MGRIDAVIDDELETQFRVEVVKRFGGKKGDLQRAIGDALELWIKNPTIERLKSTAMSNANSNVRAKAIDSLGELGNPAVPALNEIADRSVVLEHREKAMETIRKILRKSS